MHLASTILPIFAIILTGWFAGASGYLPRALAAPLMRFAYFVAMPALVFQTIADESLHALLDWHFLAAFGGGSMICFVAVHAVRADRVGRRHREERNTGCRRIDDEHRIRRAAYIEDAFWPSGRARRGDCDRICRRHHVSDTGSAARNRALRYIAQHTDGYAAAADRHQSSHRRDDFSDCFGRSSV
jgi:Predicted permeases